MADSCFGFTERFLSFVTPEYARSSDLEKVLPETNHSAVTDYRVWFKTTKWAFEGLVRFEVKKCSKSIPSLAQLFYADWLCMTLYAVVLLPCSQIWISTFQHRVEVCEQKAVAKEVLIV